MGGVCEATAGGHASAQKTLIIAQIHCHASLACEIMACFDREWSFAAGTSNIQKNLHIIINIKEVAMHRRGTLPSHREPNTRFADGHALHCLQ